MKPCIYFAPKASEDNFEGTRLRKNLKGALEIQNIAYAKSLFDTYDLAHFISLEDELRIDDAKVNNKKVVFSALYCEEDPAAKILSTPLIGEKEIGAKAKRVLNKVDLVFVPSIEARDFLINNEIVAPIEVLTPGVNLSRFVKTGTFEDDVFYGYYQVEKGMKFIASVGSFEHKEDVLKFIEVAKLVPEYNFFFFGAKGKERKLYRIKSIPKNVHLCPITNDEIYCSMLKNASIYLVLDEKHQSPISLLEVMASKTQIVTTDNIKESTYLNETRARVGINPNDVANIIKNFMANGEGSTVEEAYEFAKENSLTNLGKELEKAYEVLMEEEQ